MKRLNSKVEALLAAFVWIIAAGLPVAFAGDEHQHEGDFIVGIDGQGQLMIEADLQESHFLPVVSGLLNGWALDDPGFEALEQDEPDEGFFTLGAGAIVGVEVIGISPAFQVWTPGFADTLDQPGDLWTLGGPGLHEHPTWHINSNSPSFDPQQSKWFFSFRLIDAGATGYAASQVYTVGFTNVDPNSAVPTMSGWGLIVMSLLLVTAGVLFHGRRIAVVQ